VTSMQKATKFCMDKFDTDPDSDPDVRFFAMLCGAGQSHGFWPWSITP
jgi:hypothetical protein